MAEVEAIVAVDVSADEPMPQPLKGGPLMRGQALWSEIQNGQLQDYPRWWREANQLGKYERRDMQGVILQELAYHDPESALELFNRDFALEGRSYLVGRLFEGWAMRDPAAAFEAASQFSEAPLRKSAYQAVLNYLGGTDPQLAAELFLGLSRDDVNIARKGLVQGLLRSSPQEAIAFLNELPDGGNRDRLTTSLARAIADQYPAEALGLIGGISRYAERRKLMEATIKKLAENDPQLALRQMQALPSELMDDAYYYAVISSWSDQDVSGALGYFEGRELTPLDWKLLKLAHNQWGLKDPMAAYERALTLGNGHFASEVQERNLEQIIMRDVEAGRKIVEALPPGELRDSTQRTLVEYLTAVSNTAAIEWAYATGNDDLVSLAVDKTAAGISYRDPQQAMEFFATLQGYDDAVKSRGLQQSFGVWFQAEPENALQWVVDHPDTPRNEKLLTQGLQRAAVLDPVWAARVLEEVDLPVEEYRRANARIISEMVRLDPAAAIKRAEQTTPADELSDTQGEILKRWAYHSPVDALEWYAGLPKSDQEWRQEEAASTLLSWKSRDPQGTQQFLEQRAGSAFWQKVGAKYALKAQR